MKFDEEPCEWSSLIKKEILDPFAPRSAWIWRPKQSIPQQQIRKANNKLKCAKDLFDDAERLDRIIGSSKLGKRLLRNVKEEFAKSKAPAEVIVEQKPRRKVIIHNISKVFRGSYNTR